MNFNVYKDWLLAWSSAELPRMHKDWVPKKYRCFNGPRGQCMHRLRCGGPLGRAQAFILALGLT